MLWQQTETPAQKHEWGALAISFLNALEIQSHADVVVLVGDGAAAVADQPGSDVLDFTLPSDRSNAGGAGFLMTNGVRIDGAWGLGWRTGTRGDVATPRGTCWSHTGSAKESVARTARKACKKRSLMVEGASWWRYAGKV